MAKQDFVNYHIREALCGAVAEACGDEDLSRRLHVETVLRLIGMSDEELWQLAKLTSYPPERPVELVYKEIKEAIEEHWPTAGEWISDLVKRRHRDRKERDSSKG